MSSKLFLYKSKKIPTCALLNRVALAVDVPVGWCNDRLSPCRSLQCLNQSLPAVSLAIENWLGILFWTANWKASFLILRCVIPVVLSNNKYKLLVHMYIVKNTTIFLIVRLLLLRYKYMFRPSVLAIFRLYMEHLTISYIYTYPHSCVDIAYRKVLHVQPEDGQHW